MTQVRSYRATDDEQNFLEAYLRRRTNKRGQSEPHRSICRRAGLRAVWFENQKARKPEFLEWFLASVTRRETMAVLEIRDICMTAIRQPANWQGIVTGIRELCAKVKGDPVKAAESLAKIEGLCKEALSAPPRPDAQLVKLLLDRLDPAAIHVKFGVEKAPEIKPQREMVAEMTEYLDFRAHNDRCEACEGPKVPWVLFRSGLDPGEEIPVAAQFLDVKPEG